MARKPDFAAVSMHEMNKLALPIRACARSFFLISVLFHAMLPSEGSHLDDPNQNTHPHMSAHHEDPSKTANRSWKEQQGKCLRHFFKRIMWLGKKLILPRRFLRSAVAGRLYKHQSKHTSNSGFDRSFMPCSGYILFAAEQRVGYQISWVDLQREVNCP